MTERIPNHKHCRQCGKAFIGEDNYCSEECKGTSKGTLQKKKRQLMILYVITFVVLILALWAATAK
jgi:predicted nucleic acid-binding Zn ribbon protein